MCKKTTTNKKTYYILNKNEPQDILHKDQTIGIFQRHTEKFTAARD